MVDQAARGDATVTPDILLLRGGPNVRLGDRARAQHLQLPVRQAGNDR